MAADKLYDCFETGAGFPDAEYILFVSANQRKSVISRIFFPQFKMFCATKIYPGHFYSCPSD